MKTAWFKRACFFYLLFYTVGLLVTLYGVKNGHSINGDLYEFFNIRQLCHLLIEVDCL